MTLDDDLVPGDARLLADLVAALDAELDTTRIFGFTGCALDPDARKRCVLGALPSRCCCPVCFWLRIPASAAQIPTSGLLAACCCV